MKQNMQSNKPGGDNGGRWPTGVPLHTIERETK